MNYVCKVCWPFGGECKLQTPGWGLRNPNMCPFGKTTKAMWIQEL